MPARGIYDFAAFPNILVKPIHVECIVPKACATPANIKFIHIYFNIKDLTGVKINER